LIFANTDGGNGYDLALVGTNGGGPIDMDAVEKRLADPKYAAVRRSLYDVGFTSATSLFGTYIGAKKDLTDWLKDAEINRDANMRLQYLAGLALNVSKEDAIYRDILARRRLPSPAFKASPGHLNYLYGAMSEAGSSAN